MSFANLDKVHAVQDSYNLQESYLHALQLMPDHVLQDKFDSLVQEGYQATLNWHQGGHKSM